MDKNDVGNLYYISDDMGTCLYMESREVEGIHDCRLMVEETYL